MNDKCGDNYYCAFNTLSSCNNELCYISGPNKYFNSNSSCICTRPVGKEGLPHNQGGLPDNVGRICRYKNCKELTVKNHELDPLKWQAKFKNKWDNQMPIAFNNMSTL